MNQRRLICIAILLCGLLSGLVTRADSFNLNDGSTMTGDIVSFDENGVRFRTPDGNYSDTVSWTKFSQDDLKKMKEDPKKVPFVTPFIEISEEQRLKKTEVPNPIQPTRLKRPAAQSLFGAMLSSTVGLFVIVVLYGAIIYAAYEVALYRRRAAGLVCGLAAIPGLGILSPIIFLWLPPQKLSLEEEETYQAENNPPPESPSFVVPGTPAAEAAAAARRASQALADNPLASPTETPAEHPGGLHIAHTAPDAAKAPIPATQVFQRGAFMFNRRFFETKFPGFFGVVRRDAEKDMLLIIKSARGEYTADRISRISANDLHAQVHKGHASEEVMIPFTEIQEVRLKHKDSPK